VIERAACASFPVVWNGSCFAVGGLTLDLPLMLCTYRYITTYLVVSCQLAVEVCTYDLRSAQLLQIICLPIYICGVGRYSTETERCSDHVCGVTYPSNWLPRDGGIGAARCSPPQTPRI